jgi:hypothetical protein
MKHTSNPSGLVASGNRMNVCGPENRAISFPEMGWFGIKFTPLIFLYFCD